MPANNTPPLEDGFKVYRCSPLPSGLQPLVLLNWRNLTLQGDNVLDVLFFVVTEEAVLQAKGTEIRLRYFMNARSGEGVSHETILAFIMDKAKMALEEQLRQECNTAQLVVGSIQPVALEEINLEDFRLLALRESWKPRWKEVRAVAPYTPLQLYLADLDYSPLHDIKLVDLNMR